MVQYLGDAFAPTLASSSMIDSSIPRCHTVGADGVRPRNWTGNGVTGGALP